MRRNQLGERCVGLIRWRSAGLPAEKSSHEASSPKGFKKSEMITYKVGTMGGGAKRYKLSVIK